MTSLLDLAYQHPIDVYLVFRNLPVENKTSWFWSLLKDGYEHVEVWKQVAGFWLRLEPCLECAEMQLYADPPWCVIDPALKPTVLHVQRSTPHGVVRDWFFVGPMTCVEIAKAFVGVRNAFVRTPYQLRKVLVK